MIFVTAVTSYEQRGLIEVPLEISQNLSVGLKGMRKIVLF
jgi:hypothetical protein